MNSYRVYLGKKFTEKHLDKLINDFAVTFPQIKDNNGIFIFDFSDLIWISNQELLVVTSLLRYLFLSKVKFRVNFLKNGSTEDVYKDRNRALQLIQIWEVWKIGQVISGDNYDDFFDIETKTLRRIKEHHRISFVSQTIYEKYGITPFVSLNYIKNYEDRRVIEMLEDVYKLNQATNEIIKKYSCELPFKTKTLSYIITKELYENFLDHFANSFFKAEADQAFMSISLVKKFDEKEYSEFQIQSFLRKNFNEELLPEFRSFFFDEKKGKFKNQSYLQLSFLDFGDGIPTTLSEQYFTLFPDKLGLDPKVEDSKILKYAFDYNSSRHPILKRYLEKSIIPRGLFDLLTIVKRFNGLLVVRSNHGKIFFNFSTGIEQGMKIFGDARLSFPGTLISIYIPERRTENRIDSSAIKPIFGSYLLTTAEVKRLSLLELNKRAKEISTSKSSFYEAFFELVYDKIKGNNKHSVVYLDFAEYDLDEGSTRKLIFFLLTDYAINLGNSIIVLNPPPKEFLDNIRNEINYLSEIVKNFYIHPTPFIFYDLSLNDLTIYWLGISSNYDIGKLNQLLFENHDLRRSDFDNPDEIIGNVNYYDANGNLRSLLNKAQALDLLGSEYLNTQKESLFSVIKPFIKKKDGFVYLNPGNYYQFEYIDMNFALSDFSTCKYLAEALYKKAASCVDNIQRCKFISITSACHKILNRFILSKLVFEDRVIYLDNYHTFYSEESFAKIEQGDKIILICDSISTGYLSVHLQKRLNIVGATLVKIAAIVNSVDHNFTSVDIDYRRLLEKVTSLWDYPIKKYRRLDLLEKIISRNISIIRIDPFTFSEISNQRSKLSEESIILSNTEFLEYLDPDDIKIGYFIFNNLIHPYFFNMEKILLRPDKGERLLSTIFDKIGSDTLKGIDIIFYPKNSAIRGLDFNLFKDEILRNQGLKIVELDRLSTNEGWRFTHTTSNLRELSKDKKVLILDDGSCSGESIIQMIDEIAFLNTREIIVVSLLGRINEHKRDFFSRIKVIHNELKDIKLKVFFGSHWHVPTYYIEESPIIREKKWLEELIEISNLPFSVKNIAENILSELKLKTITEHGNKYVIHGKDGARISKETILIKEKLGRIISYRFYKEDFEYFDKLVLDIDHGVPRNKEIELICAVLLHEPELLEKIRDTLADVVEKIEDFVLKAVIKSSSIKNTILTFEYHWQIKNLLHLFFIVFKDEKLFTVLNLANFSKMIDQVCKKESDLAYLLYRLLKYIPISNEEVAKKRFGGKVKHLIGTVVPNIKSPTAVTHLRIFSSFVATLPFDQLDFMSHLTKIKNCYSKVADDSYHNEYIYNDKQVLVTQLAVLNKKNILGAPSEDEILNVKKAWQGISEFIEDLIKFSTTYPGFFLPLNSKMSDNYNNIVYLRSAHGEIRDMIFSNKFSDVSRIKYLVDYLFENFIFEGSKYPEIFSSIATPNLAEIFNDFVFQLKQAYKGIKLEVRHPPDVAISFPKLFLTDIVFKEIEMNMRYADQSKLIEFEWKDSANEINLKVVNFISKDLVIKGGGKGISRLYKLNDFPIKTTYKRSSQKNTYVQNMSFTKL